MEPSADIQSDNSAVTCVAIVWPPVPRSVAALGTSAVPSSRIDTLARQGAWSGVNVTPAYSPGTDYRR